LLVVNTKPFALVYTFVNHPKLGYVIEPHIVQLNGLGNLTLTHQRIFSKTAAYFSKKISASDIELINLLDELDDDFIFKKFYTEGKKKIRTAEFFDKHCPEEFIKETIRPFIEERLNNVLQKLRGKTVYKMGNDNNPTSVKITVANEKATVLFHFRKDEEGTRYFPTIKYKGIRIEFMFKNAVIVCNTPAWMLMDNMLYDFEKHVDGKKLFPFLNKRFIQITKSAEESYFQKFVTQLVERFDVYAEGFDIVTTRPNGKAKLTIQHYFDEQVSLKLCFNYDKAAFEYGSDQNIEAIVEKKKENYVFKRTKRNRSWEDEQKMFIEELGLKQINGAFFTLKQQHINIRNGELIPFESTNKYEFLEWLNENDEILKQHQIDIKQAEEFNKYFIGSREIKLEVKEQKDWFDIHAIVTFGNFSFPFLALKENILKGKREFILPNGLIALIPEEWFGNLSGILQFSKSEEEIKLDKHHVGLIDEISLNSGKYLHIAEKLDRIKGYGNVREMEMPQDFNGELRPYQKAGFDWFYFLKENQFGGCLADDMGLGKTIQTLALLQKEKELYIQSKLQLNNQQQASFPQTETTISQLDLFSTVGQTSLQNEVPIANNNSSTSVAVQPEIHSTSIKTSLIIVPNSLVFNWYNEAKKFTPNIKVLIYTGIQREKNKNLFVNYDLIISTYGTVRVDIDILKDYKFNYIILDESQSIKNPNSQSSRAVKQLKSSQRLVLTGTPIENGVHELWSQLSFINPGLLGSLQQFTERFVIPIEKNKDIKKLRQLKAVIKPFVLRRTKDQVAKELPAKFEQVIYCNMTEEQAEAYEKVKSFYRNEILKSLREQGINKTQFALLQGLTKLRQIANHPILTNPEYANHSGKYDEIVSMIETAKSEGHKVLVFSQFVKQLTLYRNYFDEIGEKYCYLDGSMTSEQRQNSVNDFQTNEEIKIFLISLKTGGLGLNLTTADYVFIIDPWWNPAVEQQAIDRSHRIGQTRNVFTYKFITKDTVEEKILALQEKKKSLAASIITTEESFIKNIDAEDILELLS
jgi:SNF2 family DNA or RNA helicase